MAHAFKLGSFFISTLTHSVSLSPPMASSSFFKIVMEKDLQERKLRLPESAVVMYGDYLGDKVVLKSPNGAKWPIGLTSRDGKVWLNKGWSKFAEFYSVDHGYLLIFSYEGDHSHFHVRIFTRSCLEKDLFGSFFKVEDNSSGETDKVGSYESPLMGSCSKRNGKGPAFPVNAPPSFFKVVLDDTLRDGKIKIPPIGSMKYEDFIGDKMFLEVPNGSVWPVELSRRDCEIWLQKGWLKFARFYFLELGCLLLFTYKGVYSHFQVRIFRRNTLEMDYFNLSDEDETDSNSSGEIECQRMKHDKERRINGGDGGKSAAHRSPKVLSRTAQSELEDKTERAFAKARSFKSRNPFVVIRMRPSYISTHLKLPIYFAQEHICESGERKVTLKISDMRSWSVKCIIQAYNCQTCARFQDHGWKAFARDNRLEEGDVCVFEVIPNTSKCALKVYIFQDKDQ